MQKIGLIQRFRLAASAGWDALNRSEQWFPYSANANYWMGSSTNAGLDITPDKSLQLTTYWACVRALSTDLASLPVMIFERGDGKKIKRTDDPVYYALHTRANKKMSAKSLRECLTLHALNWGSGFAAVLPGDGDSIELWPIHPSRVKITDTGDDLIYSIENPGGTKINLASANILHIRGLSADGVHGYGLSAIGKEAVALGLQAEQYGARFFANDATPGGIISPETDLKTTQIETFKTIWNAAHQGAGNAKKWRLLPFKAKVEAIGIPPEEAQFIQTRDHQIIEICQLTDVPPSRIHYMKDAKWANVEQENINYVVYSLMNWAIAWEQEIDFKFYGNERGRIFSKHNFRAMLRGDSSAQSNFLRTMTQTGIYSINQALEYLDEDPVDGGDRHYIAMNQMPIDATPEERAALNKQQAQSAPAPAQQQANYSALAEDIFSRLNKKAARAEANARKRYPVESDFEKWKAEFLVEQKSYLAGMIMPALKCAGISPDAIYAIMDAIELAENTNDKIKALAEFLERGEK